MVVVRAGIVMRGDKHLIFVAPSLPSEFNDEATALFRSGFYKVEALIGMVRDVTDGLAEAFLDFPHFHKHSLLSAVDARNRADAFPFGRDLVGV